MDRECCGARVPCALIHASLERGALGRNRVFASVRARAQKHDAQGSARVPSLVRTWDSTRGTYALGLDAQGRNARGRSAQERSAQE